MSELLVKLLLAPAFVVGASMSARRFGPRVGGLLGGLPMVAGPILLTFALAHGEAFAARAAIAALLGLISFATFVVVYAALSQRFAWGISLPTGWLAFIGATAILEPVHISAWLALLLTWTVFAVMLWLMREPTGFAVAGPAPRVPAWDLPIRALCALSLVLALTALAASLGSHLSGLLAPFPIIVSVLAAFTHAQAGPRQTRRLLRGALTSFFAFALFCFVVAELVRSRGTATAFAVATVSALLMQAAILAASHVRSRRAVFALDGRSA